MEFDKSKVYTAVNADELKVGSKCYFADNLADLKELVTGQVEYNPQEDDYHRSYEEYFIKKLDGILPETEDARFGWGFNVCGSNSYLDIQNLAYLVEQPKEKEYKPFSSVEKAVEEIKKHGGWVLNKKNKEHLLLVGYNFEDSSLLFSALWYSLSELFKLFVFTDDGTPCGVLVE